MRLLVTHEIHAVEVDGGFYNPDGVIEYRALCNYRFTIKDLLVVLRCKKKSKVEPNWLRIDGEGVSVCPIPNLNFNSPLKAVFSIPRAVKQGLRAIRSCDRYMVRLPGPTGVLMVILLRLRGKKYAVELVGDPIGMFQISGDIVKHQWFYSLFNRPLYKYLIRRAYCVAYRSNFLRKIYPCECANLEWVFSGVQLSKESIGAPRDAEWFVKRPFKIMFVGRMSKEKGLIELLHAFEKLLKLSQKPLELHCIGDGVDLPLLKSQTERLGIEHSVYFHGRVRRGHDIFTLLDEAHCFVLPSFTEGMPRSLIEAMARGVPSFASNIDAIAEVLDSDLLFPPRNAEAIVQKILPLLDAPKELADISARCFEASKAHWNEAMAVVKQGFWDNVVKGCK
jgi:glycosyltransferase involved in cell wall biosynthesis